MNEISKICSIMDFSGQQTGSDWVRASSFGPFYFYEVFLRPFSYYNMFFFLFFLNYRGLFVSAIEQYGVEIERT